MKTGDLVWIGCDDRTVEGWIILASANKVSLMLGFEAILGGHVGMMPVLLEGGVYRSIVTGEAVAVVPRSPVPDEDHIFVVPKEISDPASKGPLSVTRNQAIMAHDFGWRVVRVEHQDADGDKARVIIERESAP